MLTCLRTSGPRRLPNDHDPDMNASTVMDPFLNRRCLPVCHHLLIDELVRLALALSAEREPQSRPVPLA